MSEIFELLQMHIVHDSYSRLILLLCCTHCCTYWSRMVTPSWQKAISISIEHKWQSVSQKTSEEKQTRAVAVEVLCPWSLWQLERRSTVVRLLIVNQKKRPCLQVQVS